MLSSYLVYNPASLECILQGQQDILTLTQEALGHAVGAVRALCGHSAELQGVCGGVSLGLFPFPETKNTDCLFWDPFAVNVFVELTV